MLPESDGLYPGIPDAEYHSDESTLSSSGARQLLRCPAKFRYEQDNGTTHRDVFDFGSAVHTLVLGAGSDIAVIQADSWRGKVAQEEREKARAADHIPLLSSDYEKALVMREAVQGHPIAAELLSGGIAEQSGYWTDSRTWLRLRFRPDWITTRDGNPCLVDFKTAATAEPAAFARKAYDFGYHIQAAWYQTGYAALTGVVPTFLFIVQEKDPPYLVSVVEFDFAAEQAGLADMRTALDVYQACQESGVWPGYGEVVHNISLPGWARRGAA